MNRLNLGERFSLPIDFVTETQAILAMRRVGKTYTASVEAEELLKLNQQIVVIDPTGAWWGLKSSADGRSPGFSIPVFGGEHADVPLEEGAGAVIANALIEHRFSAILDVSLLRKNAMKRFATAFLEELYHKNREALHLFVDEADLFAPQKPFKGDEQVLGAMEDIVRRGGVRGIGCTLITQRPSVLNKDVLTQCGILVTLRMSHPRDIAPIDEWVREHGDEVHLREMRGSLSTLPKGTGWFWGPGFNIFSKVSIRARETFNSSATPKPGEHIRKPKAAATVDLTRLGEQIQATVQQAKENDPKELKRRLAEMERKAKIVQPAAAVVDQRAIDKAVTKALADQEKYHQAQLGELQRTIGRLQATINKAQGVLGGTPVEVKPVTLTAYKAPAPSPVASKPVVRQAPVRKAASGDGVAIPQGEKTVLIAVASYPDGVERDTLSVLTGYKRSSRDTYIQRLREKGYVDTSNNSITATDEGIEALGSDYEPLPVGTELQEYWLGRLPEGEKKVLEVLIAAYPDSVRRDAIDETTGYKRSSRDTYLQRLGARRLVESVGGGMVRASKDLFD